MIVFGTITTVFITAMLLNKQSAVEIEKEQNLRFIELKAKTYEKLIDLLEQMSAKEKFQDEDITKLQFITHRLAIFASPSVLNEYQHFLEFFK